VVTFRMGARADLEVSVILVTLTVAEKVLFSRMLKNAQMQGSRNLEE